MQRTDVGEKPLGKKRAENNTSNRHHNEKRVTDFATNKKLY